MHQLAYTLRLADPALLAATSEAAQVTSSTAYIPGSSVWGALSQRWISQHVLGAHAERDTEFRRLFLRAGLRFLNAYPTAPDAASGTRGRTLPLPLSIVGLKASPTSILDAAVTPSDEPVVPVAGFGRIDANLLYRTEPRRSLNYHIQREPRRGRPTAGEGALFVYESLQAEQEFSGLILGEDQDLKGVCELVAADGIELELGRSRSAQYGASASLDLDRNGQVPWSGEVADVHTAGSRLVLTLTSPLISDSFDGEDGDLRLPFQEIARHLTAGGAVCAPVSIGGTLEGVDLRRCQVAAFTSDTVVGGYSGIWGMPRSQRRALAAGSVWVFEGIQVPSTAFLGITEVSIGGRIGEGFGRFVLNWHGIEELSGTMGDWRISAPVRQSTVPPRTFMLIVANATRARREARVRHAAALDANQLAHRLSRTGDWPSGSVLGRLRDLVRRMRAPQDTATELAAWKEPARRQLRNAQAGDLSLLGLVETALNPGDGGHPAAAARLGGGDPALAPYAPESDEGAVLELTRVYLLTLLRILGERRRQGLPDATEAAI